MKNLTIVIVAAVLLIFIGAAVYFMFLRAPEKTTAPEQSNTVPKTPPIKTVTENKPAPATPAAEVKNEAVIGKSVEGRDILAYTFGTGDKEILFVGGIHGGYEWNTVLMAYELMDFLKQEPNVVPAKVKVTVIPVMNPDGLNKVVGTAVRFTKDSVPTGKDATVPGRYNANNVDLNRNFDCDWQANAVWQSTKVSGGSKAFSEPESEAIKKYVEANKPTAAVVWYSSYGGVFSSNCHSGVLAETKTITDLFAQASGYKAYEEYDFYKITGDMVNWFAKQSIPAISVLLSTHEDTDRDKNLNGVKALLQHYGK